MRTSSGLRYRVYTDSHLIWNPQLPVFLPKTFHYTLEKLRDLATVDVRLPRIAADELIYQKSQLLKHEAVQLRRLKKHVSLVTTASFDEVPDDATLLQLLQKRFDSYLAQHRIHVVEPSVRTIDWSRVIYDSTWRLPPFASFNGEKVCWEKGFRDRIIIETILHDLTTANDETVAFISPDTQLRLALSQRLSSDQKVCFFENFRQLVDHSTLLDRDFNHQQIHDIQTLAEDLFNPSLHPDSIYTQDVRDQLQTQAQPFLQHISSHHINHPQNAEPTSQWLQDGYPALIHQPSEALRLWALRDWSPVGKLELLPQKPTLEKVQIDAQTAHLTWRTPVMATQAFVESGRDPRLSALVGDIALKVTGFSIYWNVSLQNLKIQSQAITELVHDKFERVLLRPEEPILSQLAPTFAKDYFTEPSHAYEVLIELFEVSKKKKNI